VRSLKDNYPLARVARAPHIVPARPAGTPVPDRPKAVGFFGLMYRGKGFELIARIRDNLPADITIRVAGRGTEVMPSASGIEVLGGVDGPAEDAFFDSVRAVVVPYGRRTFYGDTFPSSAVVSHAIGYGTPVICSAHGALGDLSEEAGAVVLRGLGTQPDEIAGSLATAITSMVNDEQRLSLLGKYAADERHTRSAGPVADAFATTWAQSLDGVR
jgi:hypothetical protein